METLSLCIINLRVNKENALAASQPFLNTKPPFQRTYEAWDDKLKTRLIETILLGRAMNPIWTVLNNEDESEEVLDGMHRLCTALAFLNNEFCLNKNYFTNIDGETYNKKFFKDLSNDDKAKIRNYNFILNKLDSSFRELNKLRDMYEILNRSSKTLNDFEFNKVLLDPFYNLILEKKNDLLQTGFFDSIKDSRGNIETEIIELLALSQDIVKSWCSVKNLKDEWITKNLGDSFESVNKYVDENKENTNDLLNKMNKFIIVFKNEELFAKDKKEFKKYYLPYKFIIARCVFHIKNISIFNRHYKKLVEHFKANITTIDIQDVLECSTRNATFQKKLIEKIDDIIIEEIGTSTSRFFKKSMIKKKLEEQQNICTACNKLINLTDDEYHGDHIKSWTSGGETTMENLQILHKRCHELKHNS
jgi:hypothetical protein